MWRRSSNTRSEIEIKCVLSNFFANNDRKNTMKMEKSNGGSANDNSSICNQRFFECLALSPGDDTTGGGGTNVGGFEIHRKGVSSKTGYRDTTGNCCGSIQSILFLYGNSNHKWIVVKWSSVGAGDVILDRVAFNGS